MTDDVKKDITSISDEDAEKLEDADLLASDKPISKAVFKKRLNKVIGQRNVLRGEKDGWTKKEKEMLENLKELGDFQKLRELTEQYPEFGESIMTAINDTFGEGVKTKVKGKLPKKIQAKGKSEADKRMDRIEQNQADILIEKHFDSIGVKEDQVDKLTDFCKERGYDMKDRTLLGMAYKQVFPKTKEEVEEEDKTKEPDSGVMSGIEYGDKPIKTVRDAVNFAVELHKKKKK